MRTIKLNGHDTPVINSALNITANPPRPQHESPPPQLKAEMKGKSDDAKRWNSAFHKWQRGAESRHAAAIEAWRKNRDDIVSVMIEFPDTVVKWARPRSKIPGRKKEFAIEDIVEIDSRLHIHLRDGRDIGAGGIEMLPDDAVLRNELTVARRSKTPNEPDAFTTFKDAAAYCGRTEKTIRNWRDNGMLTVTKYGPRKIRILRQDLEACMRKK